MIPDKIEVHSRDDEGVGMAHEIISPKNFPHDALVR